MNITQHLNLERHYLERHLKALANEINKVRVCAKALEQAQEHAKAQAIKYFGLADEKQEKLSWALAAHAWGLTKQLTENAMQLQMMALHTPYWDQANRDKLENNARLVWYHVEHWNQKAKKSSEFAEQWRQLLQQQKSTAKLATRPAASEATAAAAAAAPDAAANGLLLLAKQKSPASAAAEAASAAAEAAANGLLLLAKQKSPASAAAPVLKTPTYRG